MQLKKAYPQSLKNQRFVSVENTEFTYLSSCLTRNSVWEDEKFSFTKKVSSNQFTKSPTTRLFIFRLSLLVKSQFHEIFVTFPHARRRKHSVENSCVCTCTTVWKSQKFSLTLFWQKFRESNVFTIQITTEHTVRFYLRFSGLDLDGLQLCICEILRFTYFPCVYQIFLNIFVIVIFPAGSVQRSELIGDRTYQNRAKNGQNLVNFGLLGWPNPRLSAAKLFIESWLYS